MKINKYWLILLAISVLIVSNAKADLPLYKSYGNCTNPNYNFSVSDFNGQINFNFPVYVVDTSLDCDLGIEPDYLPYCWTNPLYNYVFITANNESVNLSKDDEPQNRTLFDTTINEFFLVASNRTGIYNVSATFNATGSPSCTMGLLLNFGDQTWPVPKKKHAKCQRIITGQLQMRKCVIIEPYTWSQTYLSQILEV